MIVHSTITRHAYRPGVLYAVNRAMRDLRLQGERQKRERFLSPFPGVTVAVALHLPADRAAPYELAHEDSSS